MKKKVTSTLFGICIVAFLLILTGCEQEQVHMPQDARPIDKQLFEATVNEDAQKVTDLIESGANINALTASDQTILLHTVLSASGLSRSLVALVTAVSPQEIAGFMPQIVLAKNKQELLTNSEIDTFIEQKIFQAKFNLHNPRPDESETRDMFYELGLDTLLPRVTIASPSNQYQRHYPQTVLKRMIQDSLWRVAQHEALRNSPDLVITSS